MTGPYRTALRLPYAEWERAVLDGSIGEKRARREQIIGTLNAIAGPIVDMMMTDLLITGASIVKWNFYDDEAPFAERIDPQRFYAPVPLPRPFELD